VSVTYRKAVRPALAGVTLVVEPGEFVFLIGASGSGKSTLMRSLLREVPTAGGNLTVNGFDLTRMPARRTVALRRTVGSVFQDFRLLPDRSAAGNIAFALAALGKSRAVATAVVPQVLALVGLADKADRLPHELSGGEQQRVAIARALVNRPALLIADEPTGNLDPVTSAEIMGLLDRIHRSGTTVLVATHDRVSVDGMRRRVIEVTDGRVVRDQSNGMYA